VFLYNIGYIIKDISHFSLNRIKYKVINNKLVFNLNLLILKYRGGVIYKRIKVFKLNYSRFVRPFKGRGTLLKS
jgi:N6-adenosine-specific RNA methylase IME4